SDVVSISKKIKSNGERNRLKKIVEGIKPKNFGIIIRTVSEGKGVAEIEKDILDLISKWEKVIKRVQLAETSNRVLRDMDRTSTSLRDLLTDEFTHIQVNDSVIFE